MWGKSTGGIFPGREISTFSATGGMTILLFPQ